jgi:hypothetical protein
MMVVGAGADMVTMLMSVEVEVVLVACARGEEKRQG